jgi:hypothetical protein
LSDCARNRQARPPSKAADARPADAKKADAQSQSPPNREQLVRNLALLFSLSFALGACGHNVVSDDDGINAYPTNYKSDILAAMHAYLNNPTGIRDAVISEPVLKWSGTVNRYVACLRFTPRKNASEYGGTREIAAVFMGGRLDRFVDLPKTECTGVTYAAFPELQNLSP